MSADRDRTPWLGGPFDLPDEPTDADLRRALRTLTMGGSLGGCTLWQVACARWLRDVGPDAGVDARAAYDRIAEIGRALQPPPTGVLSKAGRGLVKPAPRRPSGRVGDVVPVDATDKQLRELYGADADVVIAFRKQLQDLSTTTDAG